MASNESIWHPEAVVDAEEARAWYAARSRLAARGFLHALDHALSAVAEAPARWPIRRFGCRQYVFPNRYPFTLVYRFEDERLQVVAVAHQKRHPGYWRDRAVAPPGSEPLSARR